jgi:hypothetical protein
LLYHISKIYKRKKDLNKNEVTGKEEIESISLKIVLRKRESLKPRKIDRLRNTIYNTIVYDSFLFMKNTLENILRGQVLTN